MAQGVLAIEEIEPYEEAETCHAATLLANELGCGTCGSARGEKIVMDEDVPTGLDGIDMHFDLGGAVFQLVLVRNGSVGQFACLANGDEGYLQLLGDQHTEQEPAAFDAHDGIDIPRADALGELGGDVGTKGMIEEYGCDVLEEDARFWEIGDVADCGCDALGEQMVCFNWAAILR